MATATAAATANAVLPWRRFAPSLAVLPDPKPRFAIFSSFFFHCLLLFFLPAFLAFWPKPAAAVHQDVEMISLRSVEHVNLPMLPKLISAGASSSGKSASANKTAAKSASKPSGPETTKSQAPSAEAVYAGLIEIHSHIPHATSRVQTILRPDLVNAPKLKFAVRLPSMVVVPTAAAPVLAASAQKKNAETPAPVIPVIAQEALEKPALPVPASPPHPAGPEVEPSAKKVEVKPEPAPALPDPTALNAKTALVINAVEVPETATAIPDAEIAGNFSVVPSKAGGTSSSQTSTGREIVKAVTAGAPGDGAGSTPAGAGNGAAPGAGSGAASGGPAEGGAGSGIRGPGATGTSIGQGHANGSGKNAGTGTGPAAGPGAGGGFPGITIMGGSGGGSRTHPTLSRTRPGYELTIISGGSSGGASRDLGVFGRNETVYTVYISMGDNGGGPDWSMQYALNSPLEAGSALLAPPVASKKVPVIVDPPGSVSGTVYISAVIDENGRIRELRPVRGDAAMSKAGVDALTQWEFLPAQLGNKPVATKVLIGVAIRTSNLRIR